ncbi:MAG: hypothetical protein COB73_09905 [Flavobacteriaceae bacterium]|nr:MAG: hypothetical protein COB73_09905 [Flavobacteriaceae bacterium]
MKNVKNIILGMVFLFGMSSMNAYVKKSNGECMDEAISSLQAFEDMGVELEDGGANYINDKWAACMGYEV